MGALGLCTFWVIRGFHWRWENWLPQPRPGPYKGGIDLPKSPRRISHGQYVDHHIVFSTKGRIPLISDDVKETKLFRRVTSP